MYMQYVYAYWYIRIHTHIAIPTCMQASVNYWNRQEHVYISISSILLALFTKLACVVSCQFFNNLILVVTKHRIHNKIWNGRGAHHDDVIKWKHSLVTGPLCGEFTGHRWIPLTKASDVEFWWYPPPPPPPPHEARACVLEATIQTIQPVCQKQVITSQSYHGMELPVPALEILLPNPQMWVKYRQNVLFSW